MCVVIFTHSKVMKLTIQSACQGDAIASVAGNIVENTISSFDLDFTPEELFYLYVAEGKGTIKGQSSAEFALEHLRDSVTMGDISAENMVDDVFNQCRYIHLEVNGVGAHLNDTEGNGCAVNGIFGLDCQGYSLAAGGGRTYVFRNNTLSPMSDPTAPLGYGAEEDDANIWQMSAELTDGDVILIVSKAITEVLSDDDLEGILYLSKYPADHILAEAKQEGLGDTPAAVIAAKVGGGEFIDIDPDEEYDEADGRYDPWA